MTKSTPGLARRVGPRRWTAADLALARRLYQDMPVPMSEIQRVTGRTAHAIYTKAREKGWRRPEHYLCAVLQTCGAMGGRGNTRAKRRASQAAHFRDQA